ncbi:MAG TPA: hypothetical protein VK745_14250 [Polyangiaceae bacterium]|nr:hypothetical protein [Polyangiaceae bacterium]
MRDETCLSSAAKLGGPGVHAARLMLLGAVVSSAAACSAPAGEVLGVDRQAASSAFPNDKTAYD